MSAWMLALTLALAHPTPAARVSVVAVGPCDVDVELRAAGWWRDDGRIDAADAALDRAELCVPGDARVRVARAQNHLAAGRLIAASDAVRHHLEHQPDDPTARLLAARIADARSLPSAAAWDAALAVHGGPGADLVLARVRAHAREGRGDALALLEVAVAEQGPQLGFLVAGLELAGTPEVALSWAERLCAQAAGLHRWRVREVALLRELGDARAEVRAAALRAELDAVPAVRRTRAWQAVARELGALDGAPGQ